MKYYLVIIQNDSTQSIFAYETVDDALAAFHSELAYRSEDRESTMCIIFNSYGEVIKTESWYKVWPN